MSRQIKRLTADLCAEEKAKDGLKFVANMPTEEIFTLPHKYRVDGVVHSSKPLVYGGNVIDDLTPSVILTCSK